MTGNRSTAARAGVYHGWLVVGAAFLVALFGWGLGFYGLGIYLVALQNRHGWSTETISSAFTAYYVFGATLVFFAGRVFERFGVRLVVSVGASAMACGVLALALVTSPVQLYAAFAVMSFGWAAMSGAAINIVVAPWFENRRGLAVSLALNGSSTGGLIMAPLLTDLLGRFDLGTALLCATGLMLAVLLPVTALILRPKRPDERDRTDERDRSDERDRTDDASAAAPPVRPGPADWRLRAVLRDRSFLTVSAPFALGLLAQVGFLTHQVAYLSPAMGAVAAGWAIGVTTLSAVIGRLLAGLFVDKVDRRATACGNFCVQIAGMGLLLSGASPAILYLGCVLFGLGAGNLISLPALIVQQEFPKQHFSRIVSLIVGINQFVFAFGPGLLGYLHRAAGDYATALLTCMLLQAVAAIIVVAPLLVRAMGLRAGRRIRP